MLTRLTSNFVSTQRPIVSVSLRLFNTSVVRRTGDGDHARSKAKEKAADDLKSRKETRWLDTVASDSEAIVKGEAQHAKKQGDVKKDVSDLQKDTINAVHEKQAKGHMHSHDVGRHDTKQERSNGSVNKSKKR